MFIRRGGTIYFPGVVKSVTKRIADCANASGTHITRGANVSQTDGLGRFLDNNALDKFDTLDHLFAVGAHVQTTGNNIIVIPHFTGAQNTLLDGVKIAEGTANEVTLDDTKITTTGAVTASNTTVSGIPASHGITAGMTIRGTGLHPNSTVKTTAATSITVEPAPQSGSGGTVTLEAFNDMLLYPRYSDGKVGSTGTYEVFHVPHTPWVYTFTFEPGVTESPIDFSVVYSSEDDNHYLAGIGFTGGEGSMVPSTGKYANASNSLETGATNSRGLFPASESNCWGTVTSQADTNPKVLIKEIEVKRTKKVSYDG